MPTSLRLVFVNDGAAFPSARRAAGNAQVAERAGRGGRRGARHGARHGRDQTVHRASDRRRLPVTRVLLADDHPMIRTALEVLLRDTEFEIVGTGATGEHALGRDRAAQARHRAARPADARRRPGWRWSAPLARGQDSAQDHPADGGDRRRLAARGQGARGPGHGAQELGPGLSARLPRAACGHGRTWIDPELPDARRGA